MQLFIFSQTSFWQTGVTAPNFANLLELFELPTFVLSSGISSSQLFFISLIFFFQALISNMRDTHWFSISQYYAQITFLCIFWNWFILLISLATRSFLNYSNSTFLLVSFFIINLSAIILVDWSFILWHISIFSLSLSIVLSTPKLSDWFPTTIRHISCLFQLFVSISFLSMFAVLLDEPNTSDRLSLLNAFDASFFMISYIFMTPIFLYQYIAQIVDELLLIYNYDRASSFLFNRKTFLKLVIYVNRTKCKSYKAWIKDISKTIALFTGGFENAS